MVPLRNARNVERTTRHTIAAADAVFLMEIDDAIRVLDDRARRRTGLQTTRVLAVHAAVLADQPFEVAIRILVFGEAHQRPRVLAEGARVVVDAYVGADFVTQVVPFHARGLARLAADALGDVDQLRHALRDRRLAYRRRLHRGGRPAPDIERLQRHGVLLSLDQAFSTFTRKDLNSGVCVLASPTTGVSVLIR